MNTESEPQSHWSHQPPSPGGQRSSSNVLKMNEGRFTLDVRKILMNGTGGLEKLWLFHQW